MRTVSAITLLFLLPLIPFWLAGLLLLAYAVLWPEYELIFIAFAIDLFFGSGQIWPYYTMIAIVGVLLSFWLRPYLSVYNG